MAANGAGILAFVDDFTVDRSKEMNVICVLIFSQMRQMGLIQQDNKPTA